MPQTTWKQQDGWEEPPLGVLSVTTLAYPIMEITDCEALREKIVQPLLKVIEEEAKSSKAKAK